MHALNGILTPFTPWKILAWFLEHPSERVHVNRMARELDISTSSASVRLKDLHKAGILQREKSANAIFYTLVNGSTVVRLLTLTAIWTSCSSHRAGEMTVVRHERSSRASSAAR